MATVMLSSDERLCYCNWGKPALLLVPALMSELVLMYIHDCQANHTGGTCTGKNSAFGTEGKGGKLILTQIISLVYLMVSLLFLLIKKEENVKLARDSSLHSDQHEASVKPLSKAQSVQLSHLAGESEAQFPTAIGLPF